MRSETMMKRSGKMEGSAFAEEVREQPAPPKRECEKAATGSLPEDGDQFFANYEKDRLTLLPVDSGTLYAGWELTAARKRMTERHLSCNWGALPKVLRLYEVGGVWFNGENAHRHWEVEVNDATDHWFVRGVRAGEWHVADFGVRTAEGRFLTLLRSEGAKVPPAAF